MIYPCKRMPIRYVLLKDVTVKQLIVVRAQQNMGGRIFAAKKIAQTESGRVGFVKGI